MKSRRNHHAFCQKSQNQRHQRGQCKLSEPSPLSRRSPRTCALARRRRSSSIRHLFRSTPNDNRMLPHRLT
jgi:hypothetical protein